MPSAMPERRLMRLEFEDGFSCEGISFGADKSVSGELVFQTGMVGYPESLTDPSYRGQILVCTFPLQGNYGVPSRKERDAILKDLPAYFEAEEVHISALVVASYAGENFSHWLADSSLGAWLKEHDIPAIHAVDTRALTKRIRSKGSMLGRLLKQKSSESLSLENEDDSSPASLVNGELEKQRKQMFEDLAFSNQNERNLVADGEEATEMHIMISSLTMPSSLDQTAQGLLPPRSRGAQAPFWSWSACCLRRCRSQVQSIEMSRDPWC